MPHSEVSRYWLCYTDGNDCVRDSSGRALPDTSEQQARQRARQLLAAESAPQRVEIFVFQENPAHDLGAEGQLVTALSAQDLQ